MGLQLQPHSYFQSLGLEEFHFFTRHLTEQHICQAGGSHAEPLVSKPFFAQNLFHDGVVDQCIHHGVKASSRLKTNLNTRFNPFHRSIP